MNAIMERWARSCTAQLLHRTLTVNQAHLRHALRKYETFYNQHRPHRALHAAAPLRPLPQPITQRAELNHPDIQRHDRLGASSANTNGRLTSADDGTHTVGAGPDPRSATRALVSYDMIFVSYERRLRLIERIWDDG
jgi:hypothetical protein